MNEEAEVEDLSTEEECKVLLKRASEKEIDGVSSIK